MGTHPQDTSTQDPSPPDPSPEDQARDSVLHTPVVEAYTGQKRRDQARYAFLPASLQGRFPDIWILLLEKSNRLVVQITLLTVAVLTLYATLVGSPHRPEFASLLTAALAPIAFTVWYVLFPLNPYQTVFFTKAGLKDLDQRDPAAKELVRTLGSSAAGRFLWRRTQIFWAIFLVPMLIVVLALNHVPGWQANPSWLVRVPIFCAALFALIRIEMMNWALSVIRASE